ncbi:unnamed protein product [Thlaspi arvense]|uniref:Uncharacterized protein n=1 Tax=Thlaspi arvense TaxID=13288 RepID=A0AAU9RJU6_THLAR|nr:unnamed protein product [Thlaspi arvense]
MVHRHVALLTFPSAGTTNPSLQLAKNLVKLGVKVTFVSSVSAQRHIPKSPSLPQDLTILAFSDGYDDGIKLSDDHDRFRSELKNRGSKALSQLFTTSIEEGYPVTGLVYPMTLSWAADVARAFNIPFAVFWVQPACIFNIYFHYFNDYGDSIRKISSDPSCSIQLPGLPVLTSHDLPTFLLPSNTFSFGLTSMKEQLDALNEEANPIVLVNTFDALETEALRTIGKYNLLSIGPLVPSTFLDGSGPPNTSFEGNLRQKSLDYMEWLDSKPQSSVAYVSFGSFITLSKQQMDEIALGLMESHRPFLWVIRALEFGESQEDKLSNREELEKRGQEIKRCIELVMGDGEIGEKIRIEAKKWKNLAREAVKDGGSSNINLRTFVDGVKDV